MKQQLDDESISGLIKYRLERSEETLAEAGLMIEKEFFNGAVNRLYYAAYYAVTALLLKNNVGANTHAGVKQMLGLHFVITKKLPTDKAITFNTLFEKRHSSDYDDFVFVDKELVDSLYSQTISLIHSIRELI